MPFATGLITNSIPCWLISVKNRSPSSENVMCLATQQSRDLVLANHRFSASCARFWLRLCPRIIVVH
jgi:hypothetical protein